MRKSVYLLSLLGLLTILAAVIVRIELPRGGPQMQSGEWRSTGLRRPVTLETLANLPISFEKNTGQTANEVRFVSRGNDYTLFLKPDEAVLRLKAPSKDQNQGPKYVRAIPDQPGRASAQWVVRMKLVAANASAKGIAEDLQSGVSNYLVGDDPRKWRTNIQRFGKVRFANVYKGVDLLHYGTGRTLEHDFVVSPGADPRQIRFTLEGAEKIEIAANGDLVLSSAGQELRMRKPRIYQETGGTHVEIAGGFTLREGNEAGFDIADYDRSAKLVIDPVLVFSTYIGGSGLEGAGLFSIRVDADGNVYGVGATSSANFPTTSGVVSPTNSGDVDIFVLKLNPEGSGLVFATYVGGSSNDTGRACFVDTDLNVFVSGATSSANFPTTPGAFQSSPQGEVDTVVLKLNSTGTALLYSTRIGGSANDFIAGLWADASGFAYVSGNTRSANFPVTPGAFQSSKAAGADAFVVKVNQSGTGLVYSTFVGGNNEETAEAVVADDAGYAYIAGYTFGDYPTTAGAFQTSHSGTAAFVTKLNTTGSALVYSTFVGGGFSDGAESVIVDSAGNAYIAGFSFSNTIPSTPGAYQTTLNGSGDVFVAKLNATGSALVYCTYLGGSGLDLTFAGLALDTVGNLYTTGYTTSADFPVTQDAIQGAYGGGNTDIFLAVLNPFGSSLVFSTFIGGNGTSGGVEVGTSVVLDSSGNIYLSGLTISSNFPTTPGAFQTSYAGATDGFILKMTAMASVANQEPTAAAGATQSAECASLGATPVMLDGSGSFDPDDDNLTFTWTGPFPEGGGTITGVSPTVNLPLGNSTITLTVNDGRGGVDSDTVEIRVLLRIEGLLAPMAALVPEGGLAPLPSKAFKRGSTLPLKLQMSCGGDAVTDVNVAAPRIVSLSRNGDEIDLETLDLDSGQSNDASVLFRYSAPNWIFNFSTRALATGTYAITIQTPDGQRYVGLFVSR